MDQRIYYGNIHPHALADYLVSVFHQQQPFTSMSHRTMAQKIVQGERIFVQIMRTGDWGSSYRNVIGLQIVSIAGGVRVEMGSSDWLNLDETGLIGLLFGTLFFPPLLLFPLIETLANSHFVQDIWNVVDTYCMHASSTRGGRSHAPQGFYCTYCGAFNHPSATRCHSCHAPFNFTPPPPPTAQPATEASAPTPSAQESQALVICPSCQATVAPARFCGNCAAPLPDKSGKDEASE
jgi:hypothetical protein